MVGQRKEKVVSFLSLPAILMGMACGLGAFALVLAGLTLPIPGTSVVTDPRELFATIGAGLAGPAGGLLVGVLAGLGEPVARVPSLIAHLAGALWMGLAYKKLVHERLPMPAGLAGWLALVLVYYAFFLMPGFVLGQAFFGDAREETWSLGSLATEYGKLGRGAFPEIVLTAVITTLVILALPARYRRPLW